MHVVLFTNTVINHNFNTGRTPTSPCFNANNNITYNAISEILQNEGKIKLLEQHSTLPNRPTTKTKQWVKKKANKGNIYTLEVNVPAQENPGQQLNLGRAAGSVSQHVVGGCIMPARFDKWQENEMFHLVVRKLSFSLHQRSMFNSLEFTWKGIKPVNYLFFSIIEKRQTKKPRPSFSFFLTELHPFSTSTQRKKYQNKRN